MKLPATIHNHLTNTVCFLFIALFCYAATSKFLDFQTFKMQLGQSPLLSPFAEWIAVLVPLTEFVIVVLLLFPKFRLYGLFASFTLMMLFSGYIYVILNYSSFVPCSCGGILEKMTWNQHLIFNSFFILLAILGVIIYPTEYQPNSAQTIQS